MKIYLLLASTFLLSFSFGQTKEIFAQSHSGTAQEVTESDPGNFGLSEIPELIEVQKLDDKTVVLLKKTNYGPPFTDTLTGKYAEPWLDPNLDLDSVRAMPFQSGVKFVGFEESTIQKKKKTRTQTVIRSGLDLTHLLILGLFVACSGLFFFYHRKDSAATKKS